MTASSPTVATPRPATSRPAAAPGACRSCPHALGAHDAISLRFCAATLAAASTRGCVCPLS